MNTRTAVDERTARQMLGGISRSTLYELRRSGALGFYRVGRHLKFDPVHHIAKYLQIRERNTK